MNLCVSFKAPISNQDLLSIHSFIPFNFRAGVFLTFACKELIQAPRQPHLGPAQPIPFLVPSALSVSPWQGTASLGSVNEGQVPVGFQWCLLV